MNRQEFMRQKREWAREHAEDIVAEILSLPEGVAYVEIYQDFSGCLRDDDDQFLAEFESAQELLNILSRYKKVNR